MVKQEELHGRLLPFYEREENGNFKFKESLMVSLIEVKSDDKRDRVIALLFADKVAFYFNKELLVYRDSLIAELKVIEDSEAKLEKKVTLNYERNLYISMSDFIYFVGECKVIVEGHYPNYLQENSTDETRYIRKIENTYNNLKNCVLVQSIITRILADKISKLEDENTFVCKPVKHYKEFNNEIISEWESPVKIYRQVNRNLTVEERFLFSFGGYSEYTFDKAFIKTLEEGIEEYGDNAKFHYHAGVGSFCYLKDLMPLVKDFMDIADSQNIDLHENYWRDNYTNTKGNITNA